MPDVFVSYKREELPLVEIVVDYLRDCGLEVWIDQQIAAGTSFSLEITRNILSAKCVIVCWTKGSVNSLWVLSEAMFALERQVIIPVILERCVLPPPFNIIQYIDLTDSAGAFEVGRLEMLKPRLSALVGRALTSPSIASQARTDVAQIAPAPETLGYSVDLVFVLDITGSMGPALDSAKSIIVKLYGHLLSEFLDRHKQVDTVRLRMICYRDIFHDGNEWIHASPFFELPRQTAEYRDFLNSVRIGGGGDEPESGLEALALAMRSDWTRKGLRQRHVIIVLTDAGAHALIPGRDPSGGVKLPDSMDELAEQWESIMAPRAKRLIIFAPDTYPWSDIATNWDNVIMARTSSGAGLSDVEYRSILGSIATSV